MPIMLTDIQVPVVERRVNEYGSVDHYCSLCNVSVGHDYKFQPELHTLDECLSWLLEQVKFDQTGKERK